jgi:hypothetical protein
MSSAGSQDLGLLAKLVIVLALVLFVADILWHGVTTCSRERTRRCDSASSCSR